MSWKSSSHTLNDRRLDEFRFANSPICRQVALQLVGAGHAKVTVVQSDQFNSKTIY